MRHEADVAHVVDGRGQAFHAPRLAGQHETGSQSDFHGQSGTDRDLCAIATTLHQAASPQVASPNIVAAVAAVLATTPPATVRTIAARHVYRLAPKTSPPSA